MTDAGARQILSYLLKEKRLAPPDGADIRPLLALALDDVDLPEEISRALAETLNAVVAAQTTAPDAGNAVNPDGTTSNA